MQKYKQYKMNFLISDEIVRNILLIRSKELHLFEEKTQSVKYN